MTIFTPGYTGMGSGLGSGLNLPGYTGQGGGLSGGGLNIPTMGNANISPQLASANPTGFQQFLSGAGDVLGGLLGGVQQIGSAISPAMPAVAGSLLTKEAYDRLSDIGTQSLTGVTVDGQRVPGAMEVAERGQRESQFRPFTVTTPTGSMFSARMGGQPTRQLTSLPDLPIGLTENIIGQPSMMLPPGMGMNQQFKTLPYVDTMPTLRGPTEEENREMFLTMSPEQKQRLFNQGGLSPFDGLITDISNGDGPFGPPRIEQQQLLQPAQPTTGGLEVGMTLSPQEQALQQQLLGGAGGFFGQAVQPTQAREQAIFERMRAAQRPEEERQRLALEERLAGQGRLGVSSAAYGGATPEMLAMATAQEEARNRSMLGAMQQAQAEQMQQAGLGQQFLGAGYVPQAQLLAAAQPGIQQQQLAQQAQQFGTGLFGETMMSGLEARLLAEQARANLLGGVGSNILAGMFTPQTNRVTGVTTPAAGIDLGGLFGGIGEGLGGIGRAIGIID
jgi:hypothetical protein